VSGLSVAHTTGVGLLALVPYLMEIAMDRRSAVMALVGTVAVVFATRQVKAEVLPPVVVYRNPGCPCCEKWKQLMAAAGFNITMEEDANLPARATSLGVPEKLHGCHTGTVGDYVISGHIPPADIMRLLRESPNVKGLSVPGMPVGSPGMEVGDRKDSYDVLAFRFDGSSYVFSKQGP
jgi:hypothetical protein